MKLAVLCIGSALLAGAASAQDVPAESRLARLKSTAAAVEASRKAPDNPRALAGALQAYGNAAMFAGDADGALAALDEAMAAIRKPGGNPAQLDKLGDAHAEDAVAAIVAAARDKRAVLINESHHQPMNRAFTQRLATELRKIGYTYLAAETFSEAVAAQPKYLTAAHGYYTSDPVFAGFVDEAIGAGWKLVPYDQPPSGVTDPREHMRLRESGAAERIHERIFAHDPKAKALIHVGYSHLSKEGSPGNVLQMGTHLAQKLGAGATLHVDQTAFFAHADRRQESPLYRPLLAKFPSPVPFVLRSADGSIPLLANMTGKLDMQVIFPDYGKEQGRPAWLSALAGRTPLPVPAALLPASGRRLVLAYDKRFGPDALPVDAVLVEAGKPAPSLMVPPGEMRLATED